MRAMRHHACLHWQPDQKVLRGRQRRVLRRGDVFHRTELDAMPAVHQWDLLQQRDNERVRCVRRRNVFQGGVQRMCVVPAGYLLQQVQLSGLYELPCRLLLQRHHSHTLRCHHVLPSRFNHANAMPARLLLQQYIRADHLPRAILVCDRLDRFDHLRQRDVLPNRLTQHDAVQGRQLLRQHRHADRLPRWEILPPRIDHLPGMPCEHICSKHWDERVFELHGLRSWAEDFKELQRHCECCVCQLHCQNIHERVEYFQLQLVSDV